MCTSQVAVVMNLPAHAGDTRDAGLIPGYGRSSGVGNGNPLQFSCLKNSIDREAWQAIVHGVTKSQVWLRHTCAHARARTHTHTHTHPILALCWLLSKKPHEWHLLYMFWTPWLFVCVPTCWGDYRTKTMVETLTWGWVKWSNWGANGLTGLLK